MKAKLKNILWILGMCILIAITISAIVQRAMGILSPMTCGWGIAFVETGSMEPNVPVGSLVLIHEQDNYRDGDVITYYHESGRFTVTHRIVTIGENLVVTQGDANNAQDPAFTKDRIIGKVVLTVPYLGYALATLKQPVVLVPLLGIITALLLRDEKKRPRSENTEAPSQF